MDITIVWGLVLEESAAKTGQPLYNSHSWESKKLVVQLLCGEATYTGIVKLPFVDINPIALLLAKTLSAGGLKTGYGREVAVVERWPFMEVPLQLKLIGI